MEKASPDHTDKIAIFNWLMTTPDSQMWTYLKPAVAVRKKE